MNAIDRTLLHVTPHPDDEALGCPGTLLTLQENGWRIVNLLVGLGRDEQHERREAEAKAASTQAGYELVVSKPPARIGGSDDLGAAQTSLIRVVHEAIAKYSPAVVVTASPHDSHRGHEVVARATINVIAELDDPPVLWMWGIWSDLTFPTIQTTFDQRILERAMEILRKYGGEVERNDYVRLLERRAEVNSILGAERVFGFGSQNAGGDYADLLMECIKTESGWELGSPRELVPAQEPAGVRSGRPIGWWLLADSPQAEIHTHFSTARDGVPLTGDLQIGTLPRYRIGIDIGGTSTRAGLVNTSGDLIGEPVKLDSGSGPSAVLQIAESATDQLLARFKIGIDQIDRIGVGCPGTVDTDNRWVTNAVNLNIASDPMDLSQLSRKYGVPVFVENDVNAAALGAVQLLGEPSESTVYVNVGTGIAAGFVYGGRLFRGHTGSAGEIGHVAIPNDETPCKCGQTGCFEAVCSGSAIARMWQPNDDSATKALPDAAREGDPQAQKVWFKVIDGLATLAQVVVLTYDPQHLVFGGGAFDSSPHFRDQLRKRIEERAKHSEFMKNVGILKRLKRLPAASSVGVVGAAYAGEPIRP